VEGLEVLVRVPKDLNVLVICHEHPALFKLISVAEALDALLAEADVVVSKLSSSLEQRGHGAAHDNLDRH